MNFMFLSDEIMRRTLRW